MVVRLLRYFWSQPKEKGVTDDGRGEVSRAGGCEGGWFGVPGGESGAAF